MIEATLQQILQPLTAPRPVAQPLPEVKPKLNFSTHPSAKQLSPDLPADRPVTLASQRHYGSESNLLDSFSSADDNMVSVDNGSQSRMGMRSAGSVPDLLSPRHIGHHSEDPPPLPPERSVMSPEKPDAGTVQPGYYDTPGTADAFYNTPPAKYPPPNDSDEFYNVPPTTYPENSVDNACYDVPPTDELDKKSAKETRKKQSETGVCDVMAGEVYNVPASFNSPGNLAGSNCGQFNENVPPGSGKKAGKKLAPIDRQSPLQTASCCLTDQTYDIPAAEQLGIKPQLRNTADETYDTPPQGEVRRNQPNRSIGKPFIDSHQSTVISDQTYDMPPTSHSLGKVHPNKPQRGKLRSSLEPAEAVQHSEQFSGQETYDIPSAVHLPSSGGKPIVVARSKHQSAMPADEMYDVPPLQQGSRHGGRTSLSGAADLAGVGQPAIADQQTYNMPSFVPPVPVKRSHGPPPKPPRPSVLMSAHDVVASSGDASVSSDQDLAIKSVDSNPESELLEKDTVAELPSGSMKGIFAFLNFMVSCYRIWCFKYIVKCIGTH